MAGERRGYCSCLFGGGIEGGRVIVTSLVGERRRGGSLLPHDIATHGSDTTKDPVDHGEAQPHGCPSST